MKKFLIILLISCLALLLLIGGVIVTIKVIESPAVSTVEQVTNTAVLQLDTTSEASHLSKVLDTTNAYWQRQFELYWAEVETVKGQFDWVAIDKWVQEFNQQGIYSVVTIKPFTNWDQNACHDSSYEADYKSFNKQEREGEAKLKVGKPCDLQAYASFLTKAVERYDGDGVDDMPGLKIPVKYWEIMNEPSMQGGSTGGMGEELKFFKRVLLKNILIF